MTGRPSTYSEKTADTICERIASGRSLVDVCKDADIPTTTTVFKWLGKNPDFADKYARAREAQADVLFDEILAIADTPAVGKKTKITSDGKTEETEGDMIEHRRLQVEARKWMAGKLRPKKYGDKLDIEHAGQVVMIAPAAADL
jgi:hypothetical protein